MHLNKAQPARSVPAAASAYATARRGPYITERSRSDMGRMSLTCSFAAIQLASRHAPIGLALSERRVIQRCNAEFVAMFGGAVDDLAGSTLSRLYPSAADYERIGAEGIIWMRAGPAYQDERIMRRPSGALFWCRVRGRSLTPDDPFRRAVCSFADLSSERPVTALTLRERDVAIRSCQDQTAKEIARHLGLSNYTVEQHRASLFRKTGACNKAELAAAFSGAPLQADA